jgi:hypothetical protein
MKYWSIGFLLATFQGAALACDTTDTIGGRSVRAPTLASKIEISRRGDSVVVRVNEREYVVNRSNGVEGMTIFDDRGARIASFPRLAASPAKTRSGNGSSGFPRPVEGAANDRLDCGFGDSFVDLGNWGFEDYLDPSLLREDYWADEIFPRWGVPIPKEKPKICVHRYEQCKADVDSWGAAGAQACSAAAGAAAGSGYVIVGIGIAAACSLGGDKIKDHFKKQCIDEYVDCQG